MGEACGASGESTGASAMKIEIEISDQYVNLLRHWASVGRTFDAITSGLDGTLDGDDESMNYLKEEVSLLGPPLDALHQAFRQGCFRVKHDIES